MGRREGLKRDTGMYAGGLLMYSFLMYLCYDGYTALRYAIDQAGNKGHSGEEAMQQIKNMVGESGMPYLLSVVLGVLLLWKFYQDMEREPVFAVHKKMNVSVFFKLLCVCMGMQLVFTVWGELLEGLLNMAGLSVTKEIAAASDASTTVSMFLYTSLFAPVSEELIFRGFLLKGIKKYGNCIAIFTSAVLFGVFHANLVQSVFAFGIGIVLGYVAIEYSIYWSILLHVINNFIFSEMASILTSGLEGSMQAVLREGMEVFFFAAAVGILYCHRGQIRWYLFKNRTFGYGEAFTNPLIIIYIGLNMLAACAGITAR